jgi:hypothetical protein
MKTLLATLLLALAACSAPPSSGMDQPIARVVSGTATSSDQAKQLGEMNLGKNAQVSDTPTVRAPAIDTTRRFEYAEVTVDLGDPVGMRALVPYLMKPETWILIKCDMLSATSKYYKFQKVTSNDGRSLPEVDLFKTGR